MTHKQKDELIAHALDRLGEHFDAVQILVSEPEYGAQRGTNYYFRGTGNYFARIGLAREFLNRDRATTDMLVRQEMEQQDED